MISDEIARASTYMLAMVLSLTLHEAAHALLAKLQGDSTAQDEGRLTLNPLVHLDPLGTIIIPLMGALTNTLVIGWAKPVPVNTHNLHNQRWGPVWVALAGPLTNLLLTLMLCIGLALYQKHLVEAVPPGSFFFPLLKLAFAMVSINAALAFFNLIPVPPLDGSALVEAVLPRNARQLWDSYVVPYGFMLLLVVMLTSGLPWVGKMAGAYIALARGVAARLV